MYVTYDAEADYAYIGLAARSRGQVAESLMLDEWAAAAEVATLHDLTLDFDDEGRLVGIEVANARKVLPAAVIEQAERDATVMAQVARLKQTLEVRLAEDGWSVAVTAGLRSELIEVRLDHPLLGTYRVFDTSSWREKLDSWLAHRDFALVRERPSRMPHMRFVGRLREVAGVHFWSAQELRELATILVGRGALSKEEAAWLDEAGPVGHGEWAHEHFVAERREGLSLDATPIELADKAQHEATVMANRPAMPHAPLLEELRVLAGGHAWPDRDLTSLGEFLLDYDVITSDELAWLAWAGPSSVVED